MMLQKFLLAPLVAIVASLPAQAEIIPISAISTYLNNLKTAKGSFTQINPDGTVSTGKIFIKRPGRMRFDYDLPDPALVIAGGGTVAIFDRKSNEPPQQFPLKRTPLSVILERDVDLATANMITDQRADDLTTTITAQDPENPEIGYIELVFTEGPVELRQWVITDQDGNKTTVILGNMEFGGALNASLFSVPIEIQKMREDR